MTDENNDDEAERRPMIEWIVGAISAVLVICLVVYLVNHAIFAADSPPELRVTIESVLPGDDMTTVAVAVANGGDQAAAAVKVIAVGLDAEIVREIEFDFVAAHSVRRGALTFPGRVDDGQLRIEVGGYVEP